jgi:type IV fimbrial biogenesis protein FimT
MLKQLKLNKKHTSGFTLIELVIALAIAGTLMYFAIPAYSDFSKRQALTNETNDLLSDLAYARNLAIENGSRVTVNSVDGDTNWTNGWNISETLSAGTEVVVRSNNPATNNVTLTGSVATVTYDSFGYLLTPTTITFNIQITPDFPNFLSVSILPSGLASSNRYAYGST